MATITPSDTYALSDEHVAFRDTIRQIVRERVEPRAAEIDAKAEYPWDLRKLFAEQDLLGLPFDERVRRHRHRHADAQHRRRGDREGVRLDRADPDGPGARDAADPALRLRRAQAALPAPLRQRRVVAGLRAVGARGGLGPRRDAHERRAATATSGSSTARRTGSPTSGSPTSTSSSRSPTARAGASPPSSSRPTGPASASASSSTSSASRARRPASRSSTTSGSRTRT